MIHQLDKHQAQSLYVLLQWTECPHCHSVYLCTCVEDSKHVHEHMSLYYPSHPCSNATLDHNAISLP